MTEVSFTIITSLVVLTYVMTIFLQFTKRNSTVVSLFAWQSLIVAIILGLTAYHEASFDLWVAVGLTLAIKVIVAPWFFFGLIRRHRLVLSAATYLSTPQTLLAVIVITFVTRYVLGGLFSDLSAQTASLMAVVVAMMLMSLLVIANRKGALSQIIGILSLENSIVILGALIGFEQPLGLELGIMFDTIAWLIIAHVFITFIYRQFGSLDVSVLKRLKD